MKKLYAIKAYKHYARLHEEYGQQIRPKIKLHFTQAE